MTTVRVTLNEHRASRWIPHLVLLLSVLAFIGLASFRIQFPGIQYDEALFIQPALGAPETMFVYTEWHGIPLMLMEYLGALKAWIYAPIFHMFGVTPLTIRFPMILLAAATIVVLFRLVRREAGVLAACVIAACLAVDPAFIFHSRMDWGPFVIRMFIKALVLDGWFHVVRKPSLARLTGIALLLAVGLWDKLDFIWFIGAFGLGALLFYPGTLWSAWRNSRNGWRIAAVAVVAALGVVVFQVGTQHGDDEGGEVTSDRFEELRESTVQALAGNALTAFVTSHPMAFPLYHKGTSLDTVLAANPMTVRHRPVDRLLWLAALMTLLSPLIYRRQAPADHPARAAWFFTFLFVATFLIMLVTPGAGGLHKSHHMMAMYPFHLLALCILLRPATDARWPTAGRAATVFILLSVSIFAGVSLIHTVKNLAYMTSDKLVDARWSPRIYDLSDFIEDEGPKADWIISIDWGIHNQVHAFVDPATRKKMSDLWHPLKFAAKDPKTSAWILGRLQESNRTLVLLYGNRNEIQGFASRNFLGILRHHGMTLVPVTNIEDGDFVVFRVFEVRKLDDPGPVVTAPAG